MKQPNKILVPSDLSDRSEVGIAYAAMLAEHLGSELVIMVNVNLPERAVLEEFAGAEDLSLEEAGEAALRGVAKRLAPSVAATRSNSPVGLVTGTATGILWPHTAKFAPHSTNYFLFNAKILKASSPR